MNNPFTFKDEGQSNYLIPKILIEDEKYKHLNSTGILLYSILLDEIQSKSTKAGWFDDQGNLYIIFPSQKMADVLNIGNAKLSNIKKQLVDLDLIEIVRGNIGEYDKIFVKKID